MIRAGRALLRRLADQALDASLVASFDASGFRRHARSFDTADLALDLRGQVYLVTGANSGLGLACARGLARLGGEVHLLCRDLGRGEAALAQLQRELPRARLVLSQLDVADLDSVRTYARQAPPRIAALVHNAGVLPPRAELVGGLERTLATHVAGPLLLSALLRGRLAASAPGRLVWVSSGGMYTQRLSLEDVNWEARAYAGVTAYAQTKRMQVVLAEVLAARWPELWVGAMHPGWADTPGVRESLPGFFRWTKGRLRTAEEGADTSLWLAAAAPPLGRSGALWFDRVARSAYLVPGTREEPEVREAFLQAAAEWAELDSSWNPRVAAVEASAPESGQVGP